MKIPELLAPAGNLSCALAAYQAGADAVYAGLQQFNARERNDNFTEDQLNRLSGYARSRKKKLYLTLNTLLKEQDIPEVTHILESLEKIKPHGVIIQDLGLLNLIREYFPQIEIHASTQMGLHNSAGLEFAAQSGISRVILERQVDYNELKAMIPSSPLEIEIFIHGALCCSLSGNCLFSSWLGGWSGNRGRCKQPCRRRYYHPSGNGFYFSTKDLCSLDYIADYKKSGIASLKIEGRLRKEDYVFNTVSAYRLLLDAPSGEEKKYIGEAKRILSRSPGREWSGGFLSEKERKELIQHDRIGVQGLLIGKVTRVHDNGFEMESRQNLKKGERLRVQPKTGDEGPAFTLTRWKQINRGILVFCDKEIPANGLVYRIGSTGMDFREKGEQLPPWTPPETIDLTIQADNKKIHVHSGGFHWEESWDLQPAEKRALSPDQIKEAFSSSRSDELKAGTITVELSGEWFCPASLLKKIRRGFWEQVLENNIGISDGTDKSRADIFLEEYSATTPGTDKQQQEIEETVQLNKITPSEKYLNRKKKTAVIRKLEDRTSGREELALPFFCTETDLKRLENEIDTAVKEGFTRFRVTSPFQLPLLKKHQGLTLKTLFPLPLCNSLAIREMQRWNISTAQAWVELEEEALVALKEKSPLPLEMYCEGRPHLLVTRAKIPVEGEMKDSRGHGIEVIKDSRSDLYILLPQKRLNIPCLTGMIPYRDLRFLNQGDKREETDFNFHHTLE